MKRLLTLVLVLALSGCTTLHVDRTWRKAGAGISQATLDEYQCMRDTEDRPATPDLILGGVPDAVRVQLEADARDRLMVRCMHDRGYEVAGGPALLGPTRVALIAQR